MTIYRSHVPEPYLPAQSILHYLFPELDGRPSFSADTPTLIDPINNRTLTRGDVLGHAKRLAGGLRKLGLKRGDVVGVIGMNSLEWLNAVYGSLCAGLRVSPINYAYTPPELLHQLSHSEVSLVFVDPALLSTLHKTLELGKAKGFHISPERIVLLCSKQAKQSEHGKLRCVQEIWDEPLEPERFEKGDEHETAFMCYSSGTTGLAKGVETTHHNMTSQMQAYHPLYEPLESKRDVILGYLPFSHMYSLTIFVLHYLTVGVPMVVLPRFDETAVLRAVEKYKITWMLVVPPVLITLRNSTQLDKYDLTSLRGAMSAAAPLSEDLCKAVEKRIPTLIITQAYGLTETSPLTHMMRITNARGRQGAVGQLLPTYEARLIDSETGENVPVGEAGELWVRGPSVMKGYYKNPMATAGAFAEDRWFKTGDSAKIDEEGYYTIVDRLKELIKYKGYQVAPAELEAVLLTHPEISDAAVIGVWIEDQATELPRAYVVPKRKMGSKREEEKFGQDIVSWMQEQVAQHKRLRGGCVLIDVIPKSPSGKILRKNLRALVVKNEKDSAAIKAKL